MFKKLVSAFLVLCLFIPVYGAFAEDTSYEPCCLVSGIDAYGGFGENGAAFFSDADFSAFKTRLLNTLKSCEAIVIIDDLGYTSNDLYGLCTAVNEVIGENPELFYVINFSVWGNQSSGDIYYLVFEFSHTGQELSDRIEKFNAETDKILSLVTEDMSAFEKLLVLHDHLALRAQYNESATGLDETPSSFRADGVILDRLGVCQSYTYAYKLLLDRLGINSEYATSSEMNHIWNIAELDGNWYHIDITWDDPVTDRLGFVRHNYFLVSDEMISSESGEHYGWVSENTWDDTSLDGGYFRDITGQIIIDGNKAYYILNKAIYSRDLSTNTSAPIYTISDKWKVWDSETSVYVNSFARLALKNGRLFFNTPDKIQSINTDGTDIMTFLTYTEGDGYIYGICGLDNKLKYGISTSPNEAYTIFEAPTDSMILGDFGKDSISARLLGDIPDGSDIIAAFYSQSGGFISAENYSANKALTIPLKDGADFVRLMWWDISSLCPVSYDLKLVK